MKNTGALKNRQRLIRIGALIAAGSFVLATVVVSVKSNQPKSKVQKKETRADVPFKMDGPEALSVRRLHADFERLSEENAVLQKQLEQQNDSVRKMLESQDLLRLQDKQNSESALEDLQELFQASSRELEKLAETKSENESNFGGNWNSYNETCSCSIPSVETIPLKGDWALNMATPLGESIYYQSSEELSVNNGIVAGTTVSAILENGITASFSPQGCNDPVFVKLRVMDDAHLPKSLRSNLKDAYLIGSAYGDLSTERVRVRVEKLVVFRCDGTSQETNVVGVITDERGRSGLSGSIVDRSPEIIKSAGVSGLLEGFSNYLSTSVNIQQYSDSGCCPSYGAEGFLAKGGLSGGSKAMERIGDHFAYMLENYQPYIVIDSGRMVDVTFLATSKFGSTEIYTECANVRKESSKVAKTHRSKSLETKGFSKKVENTPSLAKDKNLEPENRVADSPVLVSDVLKAYSR